MFDSTLIFIDGAYLSKISKYLGKGKYLRTNLVKFANHLARKQQLFCKHIYFYTAPPFQSKISTIDEIKRKANYDSFITKLKEIKQITIREGRLQKIGDKFTQKGVDTLLTIDLLREPLKENIKNIIIITCDTDFVPVLNTLREQHNTKIIIYYFTDKRRNSLFSMSNHILTACDQKVLLTEEDFLINRVDK
ncbi:MAG: NYN domain-containing protein [Candidatus Woesearchaeota archaeon]|nr:NYN domain-containing protein [Candidatus Woesearchaeota archaeon]